ncbi:DUF6282 family protein [Natrinema soli]|uniref:DUF6282 family protein n=1 Tax=Natrinema soli TaxID=1930624 RepID=A0ABD5SIY2_9EURY|nr:DUF6282 family protein [Natrinema soli]
MSVPRGALDIHVHAGPSVFNRTHDAIVLAESLTRQNIAAVYKSHFGNTHAHVRLAETHVPEAEVYSSATLNSFVGGVNEAAVEHALETDAAVVWLPTLDAANFNVTALGRDYPFPVRNLTVADDGRATNSVRSVLETIADHENRTVLGNGHVSCKETAAVLDAIEEMGLSVPYLVTHADFEFMGLNTETQARLADRGAILEKCYLPVVHGDLSAAEFVASIRRIGIDHCVVSTDHGAVANESPPAAYETLLETLWNEGLSEAEIEQLAVTNPRRLLGVETPA